MRSAGCAPSPDPAKRPKSSYLRFEAGQPNECWQAAFTRCPLADEVGTQILTWLDGHSRYALPATAHARSGLIVVASFRAAVAAPATARGPDAALAISSYLLS